MDKIEIYQTNDGQTQLRVNLEEETVWLNQTQMEMLFDKSKKTISEHINNIFREGELEQKSTVRKFRTVQKEGKREVARNIDHYNLDVIISVGYRVKSQSGTQFRIWASKVLKNYLVEGFAINEKRLQQKAEQLDELKKIIQLQERVISGYQLKSSETEGLVQIISEYSYALDLLDDYDYQRIRLPEGGTKGLKKINYKEAKTAIKKFAEKTKATDLFGLEKDDSFKGSLENIYQTFDGKDLYPTAEEKAAKLLYLVVKNHSFVDGNKRIAAFLFIWFLELNSILYDKNGLKQLSDSTLVALTLMLAESNPKDMDIMNKLVVNLLAKKPK